MNGALGRLAKWLRILGFDTQEARLREAPEPGERILLTKNASLFEEYGGEKLLIRDDFFRNQIRHVLTELGLKADPERLFSRCTLCNLAIEPLEREEAAGLVPEHVFLTAEKFRRCPGCGRVYWQGSHEGRVLDELDRMGIL